MHDTPSRMQWWRCAAAGLGCGRDSAKRARLLRVAGRLAARDGQYKESGVAEALVS